MVLLKLLPPWLMGGVKRSLLPHDRVKWGGGSRWTTAASKEMFSLFSSSLSVCVQLELGDGLSFIKAVFRFYMPCLGGL